MYKKFRKICTYSFFFLILSDICYGIIDLLYLEDRFALFDQKIENSLLRINKMKSETDKEGEIAKENEELEQTVVEYIVLRDKEKLASRLFRITYDEAWIEIMKVRANAVLNSLRMTKSQDKGDM